MLLYKCITKINSGIYISMQTKEKVCWSRYRVAIKRCWNRSERFNVSKKYKHESEDAK